MYLSMNINIYNSNITYNILNECNFIHNRKIFLRVIFNIYDLLLYIN